MARQTRASPQAKVTFTSSRTSLSLALRLAAAEALRYRCTVRLCQAAPWKTSEIALVRPA